MSSPSPVRKHFVKTIVSYYDTLQKSRPTSHKNQKSHSPGPQNFSQMETNKKHPKASQNITNSPNFQQTSIIPSTSNNKTLVSSNKDKPKNKTMQLQDFQEKSFYDEKKTRSMKLNDLKSLMQKELYKVQVEADTPDCTLDQVINGELCDLLETRVGHSYEKNNFLNTEDQFNQQKNQKVKNFK